MEKIGKNGKKWVKFGKKCEILSIKCKGKKKEKWEKMGKNGKKWDKMGKNGQKQAKIEKMGKNGKK